MLDEIIIRLVLLVWKNKNIWISSAKFDEKKKLESHSSIWGGYSYNIRKEQLFSFWSNWFSLLKKLTQLEQWKYLEPIIYRIKWSWIMNMSINSNKNSRHILNTIQAMKERMISNYNLFITRQFPQKLKAFCEMYWD